MLIAPNKVVQVENQRGTVASAQKAGRNAGRDSNATQAEAPNATPARARIAGRSRPKRTLVRALSATPARAPITSLAVAGPKVGQKRAIDTHGNADAAEIIPGKLHIIAKALD